jgi:hypothetical protein
MMRKQDFEEGEKLIGVKEITGWRALGQLTVHLPLAL